MKHPVSVSSARVGQAIKQVLQAERDAENAVHECEKEAQQQIHDAQIRAQKILSRADQRITNMEMRHSHKLDHLIRGIESDGAAELRLDASHNLDVASYQGVIDQLASELCCGGTPKEDESDNSR